VYRYITNATASHKQTRYPHVQLRALLGLV
jgi:hypothetical protein